jgi:hypothetical protein
MATGIDNTINGPEETAPLPIGLEVPDRIGSTCGQVPSRPAAGSLPQDPRFPPHAEPMRANRRITAS